MKRITLRDEELQALIDLMNAGVKAIGLNSVKIAAHLLGILERAEEVEAQGVSVKEPEKLEL